MTEDEKEVDWAVRSLTVGEGSVFDSGDGHRVNAETQSKYVYGSATGIYEIRRKTLEFVESLRCEREGEFSGYRQARSRKDPVLYATLAALLIKHLYRVEKESCRPELDYLLSFQCEDGLFRDPAIASEEAETGEDKDWCSWEHITLHALMVLALWGVLAKREVRFLNRFGNKDEFRSFLRSRNWEERAAWTSNEIQNIAVMLEYARDYQNANFADELIDVIFDVVGEKRDKTSGLWGHRFDTPDALSNGVQAGYHFWLIYFYEGRAIASIETVIDNLLATQNLLGGYGVRWNSSACEDIDSIDPLFRFSRLSDYRHDDVQLSLKRAFVAILHNLNADGGWVFRRGEAFTMRHPEVHSEAFESNMFFSWFRTLGLAYCLLGLDETPEGFHYDFNWTRAPGHQFV